MKRTYLVLAVLVSALLVLAIGATWVIAQNEGVIQACVGPQGQPRIVQSESECRPSEEDFLAWNIVGPKGDKGDPGPQGPPGLANPIEAFANGQGDVDFSLGDEIDMMSLDLPAGKYISYVTLAARQSEPGRSFLECRYDYSDSEGRHTLPGQSNQSGHFGGTVPAESVSHAHTHAITLDESTEVIVVCEVNFQDPAGTTVRVHHMEWNAIKIDTLHLPANGD